MFTPRNVIRKYKVPEKFGISKATLALWLNPDSKYYKPDMPVEIVLGSNSKGFFLDELEVFMESLKKSPCKSAVLTKIGAST